VLLLGLVGLATSCARSFALSYSFAFILLFAIIIQGILAILLVFFRLPISGSFKLLRSPGVNSKESIPPACVAWRAGTTTLFLLGS
jgi:hypothetical protein